MHLLGPQLDLLLPPLVAGLGVGVACTLMGVPRRLFAAPRDGRQPGACCDACGYSRDGAESEICPECGAHVLEAARGRHWRFRLRLASAMTMAMVLISVATISPQRFDRGWQGATPGVVLAAMMYVLPSHAESIAQELLLRADAEGLSALERRLVSDVAGTVPVGALDARGRAAIARLIARVGGPSTGAAQAVEDGLRDPDASVRLAAIDAAVRCRGDDPATRIAVLNLARADENERVRAAAAAAGWRNWGARPGIAARLAPTIEDSSDRVRETVMYALSEAGADDAWIVDAIERRLSDETPDVRTAAAHALARRISQGRADVNRFARHVSSASAEVRSAAVQGISDVRVGSDVPAWRLRVVEMMFSDTSADVRQAAMDAVRALFIEALTVTGT